MCSIDHILSQKLSENISGLRILILHWNSSFWNNSLPCQSTIGSYCPSFYLAVLQPKTKCSWVSKSAKKIENYDRNLTSSKLVDIHSKVPLQPHVDIVGLETGHRVAQYCDEACVWHQCPYFPVVPYTMEHWKVLGCWLYIEIHRYIHKCIWIYLPVGGKNVWQRRGHTAGGTK